MHKSTGWAAIALAACMISTPLSGWAQNPNHKDAFVPGQAGEGRSRGPASTCNAAVLYDLRRSGVPRERRRRHAVRRGYESGVEIVGRQRSQVVEGVTNVDNQIKVLPVSPMDWQIRRAEFRAIYGDPQIGDRYGHQALPSIHIIVDNGHVTLEGVVANQADKNLINIRANGVPNVFSVTNNLIVEGR